MESKSVHYVFVFLVFLGIGCNHEQKTEYKNRDEWLAENKNSLNREIVLKKYQLKFSMKYLPNATYQNRNSKTSSFLYQITGMKGGNVLYYHTNSQAVAQQRVNYLNSEVQQDIFLVSSTDTILPSNVIFERSYGIAPFLRMIVNFPVDLEDKKENTTIVVNENLFELGLLKFNYKGSFFSSLPKVLKHDS